MEVNKTENIDKNISIPPKVEVILPNSNPPISDFSFVKLISNGFETIKSQVDRYI